MKCLIGVVAFLALQVNVCLSKCIRRGTECLNYEVVFNNSEYEERQYPYTVWVSATTKGKSLSRAQNQVYKKLFRYIQGDNLKGAFINTTVPTRTKVVPCRDDDTMCEHIYTMSFPIPSEMYHDTPIPTDVDLFFEKEQPKRYIVRSFPGRPTESQWLNEAQVLADIGSKVEGVEQDHYYLNWYDPPLQLFNRLNEVWLTKNSQKSYADLKDTDTQDELNEIC